eukprot:SAG22_NODE_12923_length_424_cov_2.553846_1_plen_134_part_10
MHAHYYIQGYTAVLNLGSLVNLVLYVSSRLNRFFSKVIWIQLRLNHNVGWKCFYIVLQEHKTSCFGSSAGGIKGEKLPKVELDLIISKLDLARESSRGASKPTVSRQTQGRCPWAAATTTTPPRRCGSAAGLTS